MTTGTTRGTDYQDFLAIKTHEGADHGFAPTWLPAQSFDFQRSLIEWAVRKGRAAVFADCGLGKTLIELAWAENISRSADGRVLILTPLAVAPQIVAEGEKFGVACERGQGRIAVTNYERLDHYSPADFQGVVCDESSILKSYDGATRQAITDFMRKVPYRLLATATAAPNDYTELGTSSEALGYLGHMDMLARFFKNDQNTCSTKRLYGEAPKWRLKGHAELPFWRWVTSWARACRRPSDLGFSDERHQLPPLNEHWHLIDASVPDGYLFPVPAKDLREQRDEKKRTVRERCEKVAQLVDHEDQALVWCHLNDEGDLLEDMIDGAVQVDGSDSEDAKESRMLAFARGEIRVLVSKPKIGAWGLNFQRCAHVTYFPSHSFEQYYQAVRRCWRFGQTRPVRVDIVHTEGERRIMENLRQKADAAGVMFDRLVAEMNHAQSIDRRDDFVRALEKPSWL